MDFNPATKNVGSYQGIRPDILRHIPTNASMVLDVGCNEGAVGTAIKSRSPATRVIGIDINEQAVQAAKQHLDEAHTVDLNDMAKLDVFLAGRKFDLIIMADVLEHTIDPWGIISRLHNVLTANGMFIISIPNIGHIDLFFQFLRHRWPLRKRGIFDNTHMRFFMYHNLKSLVPDGMSYRVERNYRFWERRQTRLDALIPVTFGLIPWLREFFAFQYIIVASKQDRQ